MQTHEIIVFSAFIVFVFLILYIDLKVIGKKRGSHIISFREGLFWTIIWVTLSLVFFVLIRYFGDYLHIDTQNLSDEQVKARVQELIVLYHHPINISSLDVENALRLYRNNLSLEYITGYLIEYSLSIDNVFVIALVFLSFGIREKYYKRVLFWGIIGAVIMRFIFIFAASVVIQRFEYILYFFGALLIFLGIRMAREYFRKGQEIKKDMHNHPVVKFASRYFSVYQGDGGKHFWIKENGMLLITPLFIVLLVVEFSDVIFAVDSVPAVFSVTRDPYIVFFSNIFAILGLRSLFFLIMHVINRFRYLKLGLAFILSFVGVKMLIPSYYKIPTDISLLVIVSILGICILASLGKTVFEKRARRTAS